MTARKASSEYIRATFVTLQKQEAGTLVPASFAFAASAKRR